MVTFNQGFGTITQEEAIPGLIPLALLATGKDGSELRIAIMEEKPFVVITSSEADVPESMENRVKWMIQKFGHETVVYTCETICFINHVLDARKSGYFEPLLKRGDGPLAEDNAFLEILKSWLEQKIQGFINSAHCDGNGNNQKGEQKMEAIKLVKITEREDGLGLYVSWTDNQVCIMTEIPESIAQDQDMSNPKWLEDKFGAESVAEAQRVTQFYHFLLTSPDAVSYIESLNIVSGALLKALKEDKIGRNVLERVVRRGWDLNDLIHSDAWPPLEPKDEKKELLPE